MKKIIFVTSLLLLSGCDNKFQLSKLLPPKDKPSIAEMISSGQQEMASECKAGVISFNCEFLTKDLVDPDKWHHTKLYLNNNGKVDMDIDGKAYFQDSVESDTFSGQETTSYSLTSADGERGEVRVVRTNSSASLNFDAYHLGGKRYVMGGAKLM